MAIKYHVRRDEDERAMLKNLIKQEKPRVAQNKKRNAQILLAIDENNDPLTHEETAKAIGVKPITICRLRQRLVEEGLEVAINAKHSHHGSKQKLDGAAHSGHRVSHDPLLWVPCHPGSVKTAAKGLRPAGPTGTKSYSYSVPCHDEKQLWH